MDQLLLRCPVMRELKKNFSFDASGVKWVMPKDV